MGQDWRPNQALSIPLLLELVKRVEEKIAYSTNDSETTKWIVFSAYVAITYTLSLRGSEGFLVDLTGMRKNWKKGWPRYFLVALLGKVKGETHDRAHLLPCACVTSSGLQVLDIVQRLVTLKENTGTVGGPAMSNLQGNVFATSEMDGCLLDILEDLYEDNPSLFPNAINHKDDLAANYQVFRSLRRSSVTRAAEKGVSSSDIDKVNRWNSTEKAQGSRPALKMRDHYTQMELLVEPFVRYTSAM